MKEKKNTDNQLGFAAFSSLHIKYSTETRCITSNNISFCANHACIRTKQLHFKYHNLI